MAIKSFHRGVRDLKIALLTGLDTYGTFYDVLGVREFTAEWQAETDELRGDDQVLDRFTRIISVSLTISHAAVDLEVLDMLMGGTLVSNADYEDFMIGEADEVPYVGLAARVVGSGGASDLHMFIPKAKLSGNLNYAAQLDTYLIPSATFQGVHSGTQHGMMRFRKFPAATALEIPLRTTTGGFA